MPHLDRGRRDAWDRLSATVLQIEREIDTLLRDEWAIPLGWYAVLNALREAGGACRPLDLAAALGIPASTLSRRLDRLAEEGWISRRTDVDASDLRAVDVELTSTGRKLWREMNVSYRRHVQRRFAAFLDDRQIEAIHEIVTALESTAAPT